MKRLLWIILGAVAVGLLGGAGYYWRARAGGGTQVQAVAVRLEAVGRGDLVEMIQAPGEVQPRNKVSISAKTTSRIVELPFKEGQQVAAGDLLVKLDGADLEAVLKSTEARYAAQQAELKGTEARLAAQQAQIEGSRATLADAQREYERQKELLSSRDVSQASFDAAQRRLEEQRASLSAALHTLEAEQATLQSLTHRLEAAAADIAQARQELTYTTILAPISGIVTSINAKVGELVVTGTMNNPGTVLMEVADLSAMLVLARVDESDIGAVQVGQKARVHIQAYPEKTFEGTVETVALVRAADRTSALDVSRNFKTEILLQTDGQRIYSGLSADVEIETHRHQGVLKVPSQAVLSRRVDDLPAAIRNATSFLDKSKSYTTVVYRYRDGQAIVTPVQVGPSDLTHTLIRMGLDEKDVVIAGPYKVLETLAHEMKVKDEKAATQPTTQGETPGTRPQ